MFSAVLQLTLLSLPLVIAVPRQRRYVHHKNKWNSSTLKVRFSDPQGLFKFDEDKERARRIFQRAFNLWSLASNSVLRFDFLRDTSVDADIDIFFANYDHGDHEAFDGKGGIVAHTGYPRNGIIHLDASEVWSTDKVKADDNDLLDLRYVALHETGHALGLRHSNVKRSIMASRYNKEMSVGLYRDDVDAIRKLYCRNCVDDQ